LLLVSQSKCCGKMDIKCFKLFAWDTPLSE
jgi:hypothetical protein